jgi:integrase
VKKIKYKAKNKRSLNTLNIEYLDEFLTTAAETTPEIALGIYLQLFSPIRKGELLYLTKNDIGVENKIVNVKVMKVKYNVQ